MMSFKHILYILECFSCNASGFLLHIILPFEVQLLEKLEFSRNAYLKLSKRRATICRVDKVNEEAMSMHIKLGPYLVWLA